MRGDNAPTYWDTAAGKAWDTVTTCVNINR